MFLSGEVERERDDWTQFVERYDFYFRVKASTDGSCRLPLSSDNGSGLGIAVKTYLDAVNEEPEVTDALKNSIKQQEGKYNWFGQLRGGHLTKSLDQAWKIWDAVSIATSPSRQGQC
jgi:hypothetical protein